MANHHNWNYLNPIDPNAGRLISELEFDGSLREHDLFYLWEIIQPHFQHRKKMNELIKLCKEDKGTYKGYSTKKNKKDLVDFMISKLPSMDDILESSEYELGEALDEMFTESEQIESPLFKDRPSREVIDSIVSDAQRGNPTLDIVFDIHNDVEYGYTYRMYKHKYYKKYGNLGARGEMILYHGTSRENINEILLNIFNIL